MSLEYKGYQIPKLEIARESSQLKHSKIELKCCDNSNAAWSCKLRKFLSSSIYWSHISLDISECDKINIEDLQLHHSVATPKVDVLNVKIPWKKVECPTFVDALLWSCQPRRLSIQLTSEMFTCFIDRLMHRRLKEAKIYKFDK